MLQLRENYECVPEYKWAIDRDWKIVPYDSKKAYLRGFFDLKVDAKIEGLFLYEWKTGKVYDDHSQQRFMYGMVGLIVHPEVDEVKVHGVYFDQKEDPNIDTYKREDIEFMKNTWKQEFDKIENEQYYPP